MGLDAYWRKRDFAKTPEPRGDKPTAGGNSFVIQHHRARRDHYDFRLELDGVLLSWAVPKGPSLDPNEKRLAVHVEDHPVEYGDFEGVIPEGEYGGGTVLLWDRGTWTPEGDVHEAYKRGRLSFLLEGEKLHGLWSLVRMKPRPGDRGPENWLLLKKKDDYATTGPKAEITETMPMSVATDRTLDEIGRAKDRVWHSNRPAGGGGGGGKSSKPTLRARIAAKAAGKAAPASTPATKGRPIDPAKEPGAKKASLDPEVSPEIATLVDEPPSGDGYVFELKPNGERVLCVLDSGKARFISQDGDDRTEPMAPLARAAAILPAKRAILDGEVVELRYFVFDLLYLDGFDLRAVPLLRRKALLAELLKHQTRTDPIRYLEHVEGDGAKIFAEACRLKAAGIVAKKSDSLYRSKRARDWLEIECAKAETVPSKRKTQTDQVIVGGIKLTNPDKILYPESGISKRMLAEFYAEHAERILPGIAERPLMLLRCPEGRHAERWYQKHAAKGMPAAIHTIDIDDGGKKHLPSLYIDTAEGLVAIAQMGVLEIHIWGARIDRIERPDRLVFDLDPHEGVPWPKTIEGAKTVKARLVDLGLESFAMVSGGKGIHVIAPIARTSDWELAHGLARAVADRMVHDQPESFVATMSKAKRPGKIFIDHFRNARGATAIAPYSTRARENAPVAMPVAWEELEEVRGPSAFDFAISKARLAKMRNDPWEGIDGLKQSIHPDRLERFLTAMGSARRRSA